MIFRNEWHLGDCFLTLHFLRKLAEHVHSIQFYCAEEYHYELGHYAGPNVTLKPTPCRVHSFDSWVGQLFWKLNHDDYTDIQLKTFALMTEAARVPNPIQDRDALWVDFPEIMAAQVPPGYDAMVVNSRGLSDQLDASDDEFLPLFNLLKSLGMSPIFTQRLGHYPCTQDFGMNLAQIGKLSIGMKWIVGIQTAPIHPTFNVWNSNTDTKWINLHRETCFAICDRVFWAKSIDEAMRILLENDRNSPSHNPESRSDRVAATEVHSLHQGNRRALRAGVGAE